MIVKGIVIQQYVVIIYKRNLTRIETAQYLVLSKELSPKSFPKSLYVLSRYFYVFRDIISVNFLDRCMYTHTGKFAQNDLKPLFYFQWL